ncbi:hypothetical protein ACOMHN_066877 [Nucella lapillus]
MTNGVVGEKSVYLLSYVKQSCSREGVAGYAVMCHRHLTTPRLYCRKYPPSAIEIMNIQQHTGTVVKIYLLDGNTKAVSVQPRDTTLLVLHKVATRVGLTSVDGWALYEVGVCGGGGVNRVGLTSVDGWALYEVGVCGGGGGATGWA